MIKALPRKTPLLRAIAMVVMAANPFISVIAATTDGTANEEIPQPLRLTPGEEIQLSRHLNAARRITLTEMADLLRRSPQVELVSSRWRSLVANLPSRPSRSQLNLMVTWLLRTAFTETEREIQAYEDQADQFASAQLGYRKEMERAYAWINEHQAVGDAKIDPPFLPDHKLQRPKPIMGPKPPVIRRALPTRREVNGYALALDRRRAKLAQDLRLAELAVQRAQQKQRLLLEKSSQIRQQLLSLAHH